MKKILILLLLIGVSSCCKEEECISFSWNVGVYHVVSRNSKHLSIELYPHQGMIDAVEFSTVWVFKSGTESTTIRLQDSEFDFSAFNKTGIKGVTWTSLNYILDDYSYALKEVLITGRMKINGVWYRIDSRKTF